MHDNIRALTFDLDDTLWDNRPVLRAAEQSLYDWLAEHYPRSRVLALDLAEGMVRVTGKGGKERVVPVGRKAREALYALAMEAKYSKDEILTIYMNRAFLGAGAGGGGRSSRVLARSNR